MNNNNVINNSLFQVYSCLFLFHLIGKKKTIRATFRRRKTCHILNLPEELLHILFRNLSVRDLAKLRRVNFMPISNVIAPHNLYSDVVLAEGYVLLIKSAS